MIGQITGQYGRKPYKYRNSSGEAFIARLRFTNGAVGSNSGNRVDSKGG